MSTDNPMTGKFVDYRDLIELCTCGHLQGSHRWGMCYGNWMSCKCSEFLLAITQYESIRISKLLEDNSWVKTK